MISAIIQARMGSSRLPGKVLMKLDEKHTVLDYVIKQLSFSKLIDKKIIATTNLEQDDVIEAIEIDGEMKFDQDMQKSIDGWNEIIDQIML